VLEARTCCIRQIGNEPRIGKKIDDMIKNPEHAKYFEDVDLDGMGYGGLGGAAVEDHNRVRARPTREGVKLQLACDNCGAPNIMTIEWPEAIVISAGALPPGWKYDQGYIRPEVGCAQCRRLVSPGVTPDEAKRWVTAGINAKFIDAGQANALVQRAAQGIGQRGVR
jgi:hypothetical protein